MEAIRADKWLKSSFDMSEWTAHVATIPGLTVTFEQYLDKYTGKWTLEVLDVIAKALNPQQVEADVLRAKNATLNPPDNCPVTAITSKNLPGFLLDLQDIKLRIRCAAYEVRSNSDSLHSSDP